MRIFLKRIFIQKIGWWEGTMSAYDDYMAIAKRQAQAGSLHQALEALRSAQEIDDNDKVRRRIRKIREAIEAEDETKYEDKDEGKKKIWHEITLLKKL